MVRHCARGERRQNHSIASQSRRRRALAGAAEAGLYSIERLEDRRLLSFDPWIQAVRIAEWVDHDGDGYASDFTLEVDVDAIDSGDFKVVAGIDRILWLFHELGQASGSVNGQKEDWTPVGCPVPESQSERVPHGEYDMVVELKRVVSGQVEASPVDQWDSSHPVLNSVKLELPSEDHDFLPRIIDIRPVVSLDQDSDGFVQWRDYEVSVSSRIRGTFDIAVYDDGFLFNDLLADSDPITIEENTTIKQIVRVPRSGKSLDHGGYDLLVKLRSGSQQELDTWDSSRGVLSEVLFETPAQDPAPPVPHVYGVTFSDRVDNDGDWYAQSQKVVAVVSMPTMASIHAVLYADDGDGNVYYAGRSPDVLTLPNVLVGLTIDINTVDAGLSHDWYWFTVKLFDGNGNEVGSWDASHFFALGRGLLEYPVEDNTFLAGIADVRRGKSIDRDFDGYFESVELEVEVLTAIPGQVYLSATADGTGWTQTTELFDVPGGYQTVWRTITVPADPDLEHGRYDLEVRVHDEDQNILSGTNGDWDPDLNDVPMELIEEDLPQISIQEVRIIDGEDADADGFFEAVQFNVYVVAEDPVQGGFYTTCEGTDTIFASQYYEFGAWSAGWYSLWVTATDDLTHGAYDVTINLIDDEPNYLSSFVVEDVPMEFTDQIIRVDDAIEVNTADGENDTFEDATDLGVLTSTRTDAKLRLWDEDWYRFTTLRTGRLEDTIRVDFDRTAGDLTLMLVDDNQNWVAESDTAGSFEQVTLNWLLPGTYYIQIYSSQHIPNYTLTINAPSPADDRLEVNAASAQNDAFEDAYDLGAITGQRVEEHLVFYDDDFYVFTTTGPGRAGNNVRIDFDLSQGHIILDLLDDEGDFIASSDEPADFQSVSLDGLPAGTYYIHVYSGSGITNPDYALTLNAPSVQDDAFEQNDTFETAAALGAVTEARQWQHLALFDDDYFSFTLSSTGTSTAKVRIDYFLADGDIELELLDFEGNSLDAAENARGWEELSLAGMPAGQYYVHVYAYGDVTNADYTLSITASKPVTDFTLAGTAAADTYALRLDSTGQTIQVFKVWPIAGSPAHQYPRSAITTLTLNALGGDDQLIIALSNGNPVPSGGLIYDGGAHAASGSDRLTIVGTGLADQLDVQSSTLQINAATVTFVNAERVALGAASGDLIRVGWLNVGSGAALRILAGTPGVLRTSGLSIASTGVLDLADSDLILQSSVGKRSADLQALEALLRSGRNSGGWNGFGVRSSIAAASPQQLIGVAAILNDRGNGRVIFSSFDGQSVGVNDILVKPRAYGDVDLNGTIDASDYFHLNRGVAKALAGYANGDFDYSGGVDNSDYALIDRAFLLQGRPLAANAGAGGVAGPRSAFSSVAIRPAGTEKHIAKNRSKQSGLAKKGTRHPDRPRHGVR